MKMRSVVRKNRRWDFVSSHCFISLMHIKCLQKGMIKKKKHYAHALYFFIGIKGGQTLAFFLLIFSIVLYCFTWFCMNDWVGFRLYILYNAFPPFLSC
jgi:hypothetical protein